MISVFVRVKMDLFTTAKVRIPAMVNRNVPKANGPASFRASFTIIKVAPQIKVTKTNKI
jgi:hypothetical protein